MAESAREPAASRAVAISRIVMKAETVALVVANDLKKGDVLGTARFAAIRAVSTTPALLPESSPVTAPSVTVDFNVASDHISVTVSVSSPVDCDTSTSAQAGALIAALTIYDMCKAVDHSMVIEGLALVIE